VAARGRPVPVVYTPNGLSRARWATAVERMLGSRIDRFIAVSASERDFAVRHAVVAPERIVVIPNGIELTPPEPPGRSLRDHLGLAADVPLVGSCARLTWQKAPEVYVAAAAIVARTQPAAHFVLIGDGPMRGSIEEAIEQAGLSGRFHLLPGLDRADAALAELDVYALPSRFEGGPYTPLEAMRAGTPVIVTDAAGNRDTVRHNTTGLVVPRDDPAGLAAAIAAVLEDRVLRERLIAGARAALPAFDVERMAAATGEVYSELVARRRLVAALRRRSAHGDRRGDRMDRRAVAAHTYPAARDRRTGHPDRRTGHPDRRTAHRQSRPARVRS